MHQVPGSILGTTMIEVDASTSSVPQFLVERLIPVQYEVYRLTCPCSIVEAQYTTCSTWYNSIIVYLV